MKSALLPIITTIALLLAGVLQASAGLRNTEVRDGKHHIHPGKGDYLVMLHGWTTGYDNMREARKRFSRAGYHVVNLRYPVRTTPPEILIKDHIKPGIAKHCTDPGRKIHFLTQSLGGVLLRDYLKTDRPANLGRVVMLAPPNNGIEIIDRLGHRRSFAKFFGPTALALETGEKGWPRRLGKADFPLGIIMGDTRVGIPITSRMLPGPDDGIVSLESGKLEGMQQLIRVRAVHTALPTDQEALCQAQHFLEEGKFAPPAAVPAEPKSAQKWFRSFSPQKR
jgi:triacylglycerol lipase